MLATGKRRGFSDIWNVTVLVNLRDDAKQKGQNVKEAGIAFESSAALAAGDARNGLKYVLLRLSTLGLSAKEQEQLRELGRRVLEGADVTQVGDRIKTNQSASPLAVAIVDIVQISFNKISFDESSTVPKKAALLGAVFGAYAAVPTGDPNEAVLSAIAGAVALSTNALLGSDLKRFVEAE